MAVIKFFKNLLAKMTFELLLGIFGAIVGAIPYITAKLIPDALIIVFGLYLFALAALLVWREHIYARKARYAEASATLHHLVESMRDAHDAITRTDERAFKERTSDVVDLCSKAFTLVTGANCRACVKTIAMTDEAEPDYFAEEFCRSGHGFALEAKRFRIPDNTDFELLMNGERDFYCCNDLSRENPYYNSNWPNDPEKRKNFFKTKQHSYIATIVWPIRGPRYGDGPPIIGFLCIDSNTRGVFEPRYDKEYGAVIADMLYPLLERFRSWDAAPAEVPAN